MSVASDLAGAFADVTLTVPVLYGASSARGFFDRAGTISKVSGVAVQLEKDTLFIQKGSLGTLTAESTLAVGAVGAATAVGGTLFRIGEQHEMDDGEIVAIELVGGVT